MGHFSFNSLNISPGDGRLAIYELICFTPVGLAISDQGNLFKDDLKLTILVSISFLGLPDIISDNRFCPNFLYNGGIFDFIKSNPIITNSSTGTPSLFTINIAYLRLPEW